MGEEVLQVVALELALALHDDHATVFRNLDTDGEFGPTTLRDLVMEVVRAEQRVFEKQSSTERKMRLPPLTRTPGIAAGADRGVTSFSALSERISKLRIQLVQAEHLPAGGEEAPEVRRRLIEQAHARLAQRLSDALWLHSSLEWREKLAVADAEGGSHLEGGSRYSDEGSTTSGEHESSLPSEEWSTRTPLEPDEVKPPILAFLDPLLDPIAQLFGLGSRRPRSYDHVAAEGQLPGQLPRKLSTSTLSLESGASGTSSGEISHSSAPVDFTPGYHLGGRLTSPSLATWEVRMPMPMPMPMPMDDIAEPRDVGGHGHGHGHGLLGHGHGHAHAHAHGRRHARASGVNKPGCMGGRCSTARHSPNPLPCRLHIAVRRNQTLTFALTPNRTLSLPFSSPCPSSPSRSARGACCTRSWRSRQTD